MKTLLRIAMGGLATVAVLFMFIVLTGATSSFVHSDIAISENAKAADHAPAFVINFGRDNFTCGIVGLGSLWVGKGTLVINSGGNVNNSCNASLVAGPGAPKGNYGFTGPFGTTGKCTAAANAANNLNCKSDNH